MPLTLATTGCESTIRHIGGGATLRAHLENLGFVPGGLVTVVSSTSGNLIVKVKESRVALSREMAGKILLIPSY